MRYRVSHPRVSLEKPTKGNGGTVEFAVRSGRELVPRGPGEKRYVPDVVRGGVGKPCCPSSVPARTRKNSCSVFSAPTQSDIFGVFFTPVYNQEGEQVGVEVKKWCRILGTILCTILGIGLIATIVYFLCR